jgi:hypothetical protein
MQTYPDLSRIFSAKAQRRLALAALSWEEKVAIVERMRVLLPKGSWKHRPEDEGSPTHKTPAQPRTLRNPAD